MGPDADGADIAEVDGADGFIATFRTGKAGDAEGVVGAHALSDAICHRDGDFGADRSVLFEEAFRNVEPVGFNLVPVADNAAFKNLGSSRDVREATGE